MSGYQRIIYLALIMAAVVVVASGSAIVILYNTAFDGQGARLVETVKSQARLIEAMARFDARFSKLDHPEGATGATISQLREAHSNYQGFGETGEFTLARREGDNIVFLLRHRYQDVGKPEPVPFDLSRAEPMRHALSGRSGTVVGLDYRGVMVLAAHEPVAVLDLGIVAKIDLAEIRAPFLRAGGVVIAITLLLIAAGTTLFFTVANPIVRRIEESEERLSAIFSNVFDAIINIDSHGIVEAFNPAAERMFGYDAAEVVGKYVSILMPEPVFSEHDGLIKHYLETGKGPIGCFACEVEGKRKDGSVFPADLGLTRMEVGGSITFIGTMRDITERKRAEEALRESEERFKDIAEAASDWFWKMDENLRFTAFSDRRRQLFGISPEESVGETRWEVADVNSDDDEKWRHHRATLEAHRPFRDFEYALTRKDGKTRYNKVSGMPVFDANGVFKGYRGAATDVTEQKEAELQLIQASKLATLGEMASAIAHELNQPLSVVGMAAELSLMSMEEGEFDTEFVRKKLETIVAQKERMAAIVNHMRVFSRKDKAELESFDPLRSVSGAVRLIEKQFHASGIDLEEDLPAACRHVSGHPAQLEQVVLNLLTNAQDAVLGEMDGGGSGNSGRAPMMRVSLVDDKRRKTVVISVADNGGGIPEQALERIFDPFFTTKTEGHGTGLGLSIGHSIIDSMGGRLEARNVDGGATFQISLPVATDGLGGGEGVPRGRKDKTRSAEPDSNLRRILVVDDEQAIADEVAEYLRRQGYDVVTAGNGREALKVHRARPADMVITDLLMPGMGGNELIQRLHRSDPELPIVVVTGHTTFGDDQDAVVEGASVVLKKPIVLSELLGTLSDMRVISDVGLHCPRQKRKPGRTARGPKHRWWGQVPDRLAGFAQWTWRGG